MSYFTFNQFEKGMAQIKPYLSRNFRAQIFFKENTLSIYLPPGKTLSQATLANLEAIGWKYDSKFHKIYFITPDITELLTHSDKHIRGQAVRHIACLKKNSA